MKHISFLTAVAMMGICSTAMAGHHTEEVFFKRDTNNDVVVSKAEYIAATESKFSQMDTNGDGVVNNAEHQASMNKWKKQKNHDHQHKKSMTE